jgi:hypothetical protein
LAWQLIEIVEREDVKCSPAVSFDSSANLRIMPLLAGDEAFGIYPSSFEDGVRRAVLSYGLVSPSPVAVPRANIRPDDFRDFREAGFFVNFFFRHLVLVRPLLCDSRLVPHQDMGSAASTRRKQV